jgi:hypothetical protein
VRANGLALVFGAYALGAAVLAVACNSSTTAPMLGDTTLPPGNTSDGSSSSAVEGGSVDDASLDGPSTGSKDGAAADATDARTDGNDGAPNDARAGDATAADASQVSTGAGASDAGPLCDPAHVWTLAHRVPSVPGTDFAYFGGIGVDELTVAWTGSTGAVYTADRPTRTDAFAAPVLVPPPTTIGAPALDRVGLGPTGLTLVAVVLVGDGGVGTQLIGFERSFDADAGIYSAWALSTLAAFANVNAMISSEVGGALSAPVLSADGNSLFYTLTSAGVPTLYESRWDAVSRAWASGTAALSASVLAGAGAVATGTSSDGRTLFFFDVGASVERGAWRASPASAFVQFADESAIPQAVPNFGCTTIYFQSTDTSGNGAFVAQ